MIPEVDKHTLPQFKQFKEEWHDWVDLEFFIQMKGSLDLAVAFGKILFWPKFRLVNGCYVRDFDGKIYTEAEIPANLSLPERQKIERLYNHIDLHGRFLRQPSDTPLVAYEYVGEIMLRTWLCALREQFPGVQFEGACYIDDEVNDATVVVWHEE